jgi:hypothetical protein
MANKKKVDTNQLIEKLEPVSEAVAKASQTVKEAAVKAAPAVKAAGKTATKTIRKAADAGKKAATAIIPEVYLQWQGKELLTSELVERVKADYRAQNKGAILSCKIYVKPEDGTAYYVINDTEGKITL